MHAHEIRLCDKLICRIAILNCADENSVPLLPIRELVSRWLMWEWAIVGNVPGQGGWVGGWLGG